MRSVYRFIVLTLVSILFYQCQREVSYIGGGDPGQVVLPSPLKANLQGNVLDENGQPAANVTIKVGSELAVTDTKGYFRINNAPLDKNAAVVTAEKIGYFKAYRTFSATSGTNQVVIKLTKKNLGGTVDAASGGDVSLSNGTKISLPANGIVKASDNSNYTGTVNVYAAYMDPTDPDILQKVPGSFMANDKEGKRVFLTSYGMMAVELESSTGERLQIKSGNTATLTSPIPSSIQANAPATIPLWYVDETTGLWKEEGTATKQGNNYVGTVQHFSFWNYDFGSPAVTLSVTLKTSKGQPLVNAWVVITADKYGSASGYTDSLGQVKGLVPANANLVLEVRDNCGSSIFTKNIGSHNENFDLGVITVSPTTPSVITVQGRLTNCGGANVTKGYAIVSINNQVHYAKVDGNGNFSTNYVVCNISATDVQVVGVDETAQQQGNATTIPVVAPTTDAGTIAACGISSTEYIDYTLDGTSYHFATGDSLLAYTMADSINTGKYVTYIMGAKFPDFIQFRFNSTAQAAGTYSLAFISVQNYFQTTVVSPLNVNLSSFATSAGLFYQGSFNGQFKDGSNVTHTISCTFKVRRAF